MPRRGVFKIEKERKRGGRERDRGGEREGEGEGGREGDGDREKGAGTCFTSIKMGALFSLF